MVIKILAPSCTAIVYPVNVDIDYRRAGIVAEGGAFSSNAGEDIVEGWP